MHTCAICSFATGVVQQYVAHYYTAAIGICTTLDFHVELMVVSTPLHHTLHFVGIFIDNMIVLERGLPYHDFVI
jgi:hypothetical protein